MDRNGYIGRAPADSSVIVARQVFSPSGVTTDFTFTSGYTPGYLDLYLNGSRLVEGTDYTATDTSTISVLNGGADGGDVVEAVAYKAFNVATATVGISSAGTSIGSVNALNFVGAGNTFALRGSTIDISISGSSGGGGVASTITVADESSDTTCFPVFVTAATGDLNPKSGSNLTFNSSSGALTASSFAGNLSGGTVAGSTGTFTGVVAIDSADGYALEVKNGSTQLIGLYKEDATGGYIYVRDASGTSNISLNGNDGSATFAGNVSIAGTLTYEDVTNIDSVGIITARSDVSIADKIIHTGDTDTAIRFPAADTFTVETAGSERLRVNDAGDLQVGNITNLVASGAGKLNILSDNTTNLGIATDGAINIACVGGAGGSRTQSINWVPGFNVTLPTASIGHVFTDGSGYGKGDLFFATRGATTNTAATERLRITSSGDVGIGTNSPARSPLHIHKSGSDVYLHLTNSTTGVGSGDGFTIHQSGVETLLNNRETGNMRLYTSGTERIRIGSSGQIGIAGANYGSSGQVLTSKGSGSAVAWESVSVGITTEAATVTNGQTTLLDLGSAQDHKLTCTGTVTISCTGGTEADSHTVRIINSGITTVGFSTYFLFPSGSAPSLPTADGAISLISFTVNRVGAAGTQLLAGASLNYS